ncbi:MAG: saccharopine dehydrogenase [Rhodobacterales bacterium 12-64-8]|nr:MAG: saccharopine dehydrogenase [Rhodobacterales bacterium 12-64-8]OYX50993.1 MAG: saccharopine dehydrogenase [Alphaproteobacteria bacterium 32-64-14]
MTADREFDVIVYGATGFTGRLVAEHMLATHGVGRGVKWAMAGRSKSKLEGVRQEIGAPADVPLIIADASNPASLDAMAQRAKVIITTVGPYQLYGEPMVAACVKAGTDYVDLCGEPAWMAAMIAKYDAPAKASGARIVFSCGFDSIPFDLGVTFLQNEAIARLGVPVRRVRGRVRKMKGGFSGGTIASLMATLEASKKDPTIPRTLGDPFALTPGFKGPAQPSGETVERDDAAGQWATPFIMAMINTKNVHRSNHLLGRRWGADFVYDEMMLTGDGEGGQKRAKAAKRQGDIQNMMLNFPPTRALLRRFALPKPGEGPSKEERETGFYEAAFHGETADGRVLRAVVKGDKDPGYGSTSKMISESALCLARDVSRDEAAGGVWTPGAALGAKLIARLETHAGMKFSLEN